MEKVTPPRSDFSGFATVIEAGLRENCLQQRCLGDASGKIGEHWAWRISEALGIYWDNSPERQF